MHTLLEDAGAALVMSLYFLVLVVAACVLLAVAGWLAGGAWRVIRGRLRK